MDLLRRVLAPLGDARAAIIRCAVVASCARGFASRLATRLEELARAHGFHKMVLSAFPTNTGGVALYTRHGFRTVGIYEEMGRLDGHGVDTIIMEKLLEPSAAATSSVDRASSP